MFNGCFDEPLLNFSSADRSQSREVLYMYNLGHHSSVGPMRGQCVVLVYELSSIFSISVEARTSLGHLFRERSLHCIRRALVSLPNSRWIEHLSIVLSATPVHQTRPRTTEMLSSQIHKSTEHRSSLSPHKPLHIPGLLLPLKPAMQKQPHGPRINQPKPHRLQPKPLIVLTPKLRQQSEWLFVIRLVRKLRLTQRQMQSEEDPRQNEVARLHERRTD